jgi:hypothetical protein
VLACRTNRARAVLAAWALSPAAVWPKLSGSIVADREELEVVPAVGDVELHDPEVVIVAVLSVVTVPSWATNMLTVPADWSLKPPNAAGPVYRPARASVPAPLTATAVLAS